MTERIKWPRYWLVCSLPWSSPPGTPIAEAAYAMAPSLLPASQVSDEVNEVFRVASQFADARRTNVVFFSDLTKWLDQGDADWASLGVDWERAVEGVQEAPTPGLFLTVSQRAHIILSDASRNGAVLHFTNGASEQTTPEERELVRDALRQQLERDWPDYIQGLVDGGRLQIR